MRIVLLGDIHFYRLWFAPWHLLSKRILGHTNLLLNRRKVFRHELFAELVHRAVALNPDRVLLSGDLTTTALKQEFLDCAEALRPLTDQVKTLMVPGNHDRYTFTSRRVRRADRLLAGLCPPAFPHTEALNDRWELLALDAAVPRVFNARGRLGAAQIEGIQRYLDTLEAGKGLVVLCHYPCVVPAGVHEHESHAMEEAVQLRELLAQCPARLVYLHGHIHRPWHHEPGDGSGVPFTCIDAGAPCMVGRTFPSGQGFYEIVLPDDPTDALAVTHHVLNDAGPGRGA
ncbi:MAG: metallophosphoesterase [Planctomycetota bacterium]